MKTLIELYDARPVENILSAEVFLPETIVYICTPEIAENPRNRRQLENYFRHRGLSFQLAFVGVNIFRTEEVVQSLLAVQQQYSDCALDITGGNETVLFAAGLCSASCSMPVFTYSRRKNTFYSVHGADFAMPLPDSIHFRIRDIFQMAGGSLRQGRVDNRILKHYMDLIDPYFALYLRYKKQWARFTSFMQQASPTNKHGAESSLCVSCSRNFSAEHGVRATIDPCYLQELQNIGMLRELELRDPDRVHFTFQDQQTRIWLRDVGSVLELYLYKACLDTGAFQDVCTSAVVDWDGKGSHDDVSNEIDVMAVSHITPLFISCKTCDVKTEALNELAVLRNRFGGEMARAVIVTTEHMKSVTRHRASELGIRVVDIEDLESGNLQDFLKSLA